MFISPVTGAFTHLSDGASSITRDYLDLVHVRDENAHLRNELARVKSDQARLAELEVENQHLSELLALKDALGTIDAMGCQVEIAAKTAMTRVESLREQ